MGSAPPGARQRIDKVTRAGWILPSAGRERSPGAPGRVQRRARARARQSPRPLLRAGYAFRVSDPLPPDYPAGPAADDAGAVTSPTTLREAEVTPHRQTLAEILERL